MNARPANDLSHRWTLWGLAVAILGCAAGLQVGDNHRAVVPGLGVTLPETCYFKLLCGVGCPGCGLTRCFICLAHGDVRNAWRFNPGGLLCFAIVLFQLPYQAIQIYRIRHGLPEWQLTRSASIAACLLFAALIAQWVWRWFTGDA
jgi:hypothetical protein